MNLDLQHTASNRCCVSRSRYPDVLIPHLAATLSMQWETPPPRVISKLSDMAATPRTHEGESDLATRCGIDAVAELKRVAVCERDATFAAMCSVQGRLIGDDQAVFRSSSAYTDSRGERYAFFESLPGMFEKKVGVDLNDNCHPLVKAVRLYLDIIFVHPFPDGNARAALLWFSYFCFRNELPHPNYRRLFGFDFVPGNKACYWRFAELVAQEIS